ncbi:MAG: tetraacyldisaccharide 4'-kinase [Thermodesulfobacteriota bacterium]
MRPYWHNLFRRLQGAEGAGPPPNAGITTVAAVASCLYGLGAGLRRTLYVRGVFEARRLPAPVVSVGNLTVGGTGKTPVVASLARLWQDRGKRVAILSRGYGGQTQGVIRLSNGERLYHRPPEVGDEPYWLARNLPGVAVYTGACRYAAGLAAWKEFKPDIFLLDDGFQHFQLHRDLDLVLLDATSPFGNGFLLPRGPLREPRTALNTAQIIVLTRFDPERHQASLVAIQASFPNHKVLTSSIYPVRVTSHPGGHSESPESLRHRPLMAFAGLARPEVFAAALRQLGADLKGFQTFPDHHVYTSEELRHLAEAAGLRGAGALVTTGKDWMRLGEHWDEKVLLWVLEVEARLSEPERLLEFFEQD